MRKKRSAARHAVLLSNEVLSLANHHGSALPKFVKAALNVGQELQGAATPSQHAAASTSRSRTALPAPRSGLADLKAEVTHLRGAIASMQTLLFELLEKVGITAHEVSAQSAVASQPTGPEVEVILAASAATAAAPDEEATHVSQLSFSLDNQLPTASFRRQADDVKSDPPMMTETAVFVGTGSTCLRSETVPSLIFHTCQYRPIAIVSDSELWSSA